MVTTQCTTKFLEINRGLHGREPEIYLWLFTSERNERLKYFPWGGPWTWVHGRSPCAPSSRASFISLCFNSYYTEKSLHKSALSFEVDRSKTLEVALLRAEPFLGTKHMYRNRGSACWVMAGLSVLRSYIVIPRYHSLSRSRLFRPWCLRLTIVFQSYKSLFYKYMFQKSPFCKNHITQIQFTVQSVGIPNKPSSQSHSLYPHSPPDSSCFRFQLGDLTRTFDFLFGQRHIGLRNSGLFCRFLCFILLSTHVTHAKCSL